jgi:hypothetical protein
VDRRREAAAQGRIGLLVAAIVTTASVLVSSAGHAGDAARVDGGTQVILGPNTTVDSLYTTVRGPHDRLYAFMGNTSVYMYRQQKDGTLSQPRQILRHGPKGSADQCGVHLVGTIYKATRRHWITFYHAERAAPADHGDCNHADKHTRWTVRRVQTFDAGKTWVKGNTVVSQDTELLRNPKTGTWSYHTDDTGSPRLVVRHGWMYLFYRAANLTSNSQEMSVARAPVRSLGTPGSWRKWYDGGWTQPGLGGHQSTVTGLPASARGISYNTYLHEYVSVLVDIHGIVMYQSSDLTRWTKLAVVSQTGLDGSAWGAQKCNPNVGLPAAYGYGAIIGDQGSDATSGRHFYVYYMEKPAGDCFDHRYLLRRPITLVPNLSPQNHPACLLFGHDLAGAPACQTPLVSRPVGVAVA